MMPLLKNSYVFLEFRRHPQMDQIEVMTPDTIPTYFSTLIRKPRLHFHAIWWVLQNTALCSSFWWNNFRSLHIVLLLYSLLWLRMQKRHIRALCD